MEILNLWLRQDKGVGVEVRDRGKALRCHKEGARRAVWLWGAIKGFATRRVKSLQWSLGHRSGNSFGVKKISVFKQISNIILDLREYFQKNRVRNVSCSRDYHTPCLSEIPSFGKPSLPDFPKQR